MAAAVLLTGCPNNPPEPGEAKRESRLADTAYVQQLDAARSEQNRIQCELEAVRQAREALKAEDPELTGEKAKELEARQDALLAEFGESRRHAAAMVRARIHQDIQNEKTNALNLQKKGN